MWIVKKDINESFEIVGTNLHVTKDGKHQLWATKTSDRTIMLVEGEEELIRDYKDAIDYAISNGKESFTI